MKKAILIFVAGFTVISCKKDYTCSCTVTDSDPSGTPAYTTNTTLVKVTDSQAKVNCHVVKQEYNNNSNVYTKTYNCTLK